MLTDVAAEAAPPAGPAPALRVGVMVDALSMTAWEYRVLEEIQRSDFARVAMVVMNETPPHRTSTWLRLRRRWRHALFAIYQRADYALMKGRVRRDAFARRDASSLLAEVPMLRVRPVSRGFTDRLADGDLHEIRAADLDVMIRFGFRILRGDVLDAARHGVWSLHHGCNERYRGGPAFFWEIFRDDPVSATVLQVLNDQLDAGQVIYKSWAATYRFSLFISRNAAFWKSSDFHLRRLRDLHQRGWAWIADQEAARATYDYSTPINRYPTNGQMLVFAARLAGRILHQAWTKATTRTQWFLAIRPRDAADAGGWRTIRPPADRFWADPHALSTPEQEFLFVEELPFRTGRGRIAACEIADGMLGPMRPVLELPIHVSYPFVFEDAGTVYMLPETRRAGRIQLYRAERLPDRWVPDRVLLDEISAVDSTIVRHAGRYWLFTCVAVAGEESNDELRLYHARSLDGPWVEHLQSPVVSDVRRARPAGALFTDGETLIRPSQEGGGTYGRAVLLNAVEELTPTAYRERTVGRIDGGEISGNLGSHTLTRLAAHDVIDGRARLPRWSSARAGPHQ